MAFAREQKYLTSVAPLQFLPEAQYCSATGTCSISADNISIGDLWSV